MTPKEAYEIAEAIAHGRDISGRTIVDRGLELIIATDSFWSYTYAKYVLHGRFKLGERAISESGEWSYIYALCILYDRFPLGEDAIRYTEYAQLYEMKFGFSKLSQPINWEKEGF